MAEKEPKKTFRPPDRSLIAATIIAGSAWALNLQVNYSLVQEACGDRSKLMLHVVAAVCLVITLGAAALAWRVRGQSELVAEGTSVQNEQTKWLATMVTIFCLSMTVVIIAQEIPNIILRSCD